MYAWHAAVLAGRPAPIYEGEDGLLIGDNGFWTCGWFKVRHVRKGAFVPARIYLLQMIDPETGELTADEVLRCEIDGKDRDPLRAMHWIVETPIPKHEFDYLTALRHWQRVNAPEEYEAAWRPVDNLSTPILE
jgi:hypothetical protein